MPDLVGGQPAHGERETLDGGVIHAARQPPPHAPLEDARDLGLIGQVVLDDVDFLLGLFGNRQDRRDEQDVAAPVLQSPVEVSQAADDLGPPIGGGREILQEEEPLSGRLEDRLQRAQRVARFGHGDAVDDQTVHDRPDTAGDGLAVEGLGQVLRQPFHARLFPCLHVDERMASKEGAANPLRRLGRRRNRGCQSAHWLQL